MDSTFDDTKIPLTSINSGETKAYAADISVLVVQIVNVVFVGTSASWVLVDAGMPKSGPLIIKAAEELFGRGNRPRAIVLTHGHFDHVGAIIELIEQWNVPVYAHISEIPYLTGNADYPPGDGTVDGGLVSELSPLFPNHGINLDSHVHPLNLQGTIPGMDGWKWIHTPGHTPGHISLFREQDHVLIAGDAFVTVKQESLYKVVLQTQEISGPPKYFTTDWEKAWESVRRLEALKPRIAITGHGIPMSGDSLADNLHILVKDFERIAIPSQGKFVH